MYRTHTCGELRMADVGKDVTLSGWVQISRDMGGLTFVDLRDRYGITQLVFDMEANATLCETARKLGREFVVRASGKVNERSSKNPNRATGDIEIIIDNLEVLNASKTPPFTIEEETDGGDDIRMQYRYLDLRRGPLQNNLIFRSKLAIETRKYLDAQGFIEVETPCLIKSTPEGARDFVVPSRMNPGQFYALPQSPQTFKQILMVAGYDKYFQIVKCFRDEDLRADRQPEFTQIDCEMAFVSRDEVLATFEGLTKHVFKKLKNIDLDDFPKMEYDEAMKRYGSDKPDVRFDMEFVEMNDFAQGKGFSVFDNSELVVGICAKGIADKYSNKDMKLLTEWMQRPQIGAKGLVYVKFLEDGSIKSTVGKETDKTRKQLNELRLEMGTRLGLRDKSVFAPLWVINFPLLEWDEESERFHAMHHPFTAPKKADEQKMLSGDHETLKNLKADAYDLVINGVEIGGGSIRIHDRTLQSKNFDLLGFTKEEAEAQFGFLLGAFEIRDFIAFPKNNQGRDMMIDAPSPVDGEQLDELNLALNLKENT